MYPASSWIAVLPLLWLCYKRSTFINTVIQYSDMRRARMNAVVALFPEIALGKFLLELLLKFDFLLIIQFKGKKENPVFFAVCLISPLLLEIKVVLKTN